MKLDLRRKVRGFSTGMKQKLALSQAFADPVDVLILDEPTSALDPSARQDVLALVEEARVRRADGRLLGPRPERGRAGGRPRGDHAPRPPHARRGHARPPQFADGPGEVPRRRPVRRVRRMISCNWACANATRRGPAIRASSGEPGAPPVVAGRAGRWRTWRSARKTSRACTTSITAPWPAPSTTRSPRA